MATNIEHLIQEKIHSLSIDEQKETLEFVEMLEKKASQKDRLIWDVISEISAQISDDDWIRIPADASLNADEYLYSNEREQGLKAPKYSHRGARFEIKTSASGKYHFSLKAKNGQIILTSETYDTRQQAELGIESIKQNVNNDERYERKTTDEGTHYFFLKALNGNIVATSEEYTTNENMENDILFLESVDRFDFERS